MSLGGTGLFGENESSSDPNGASTELKGSRERLAVEETAGGDDLHGLAGQRALVSLDQGSNGRDEDRSGDITSVAATLATLGADEINTKLEALLDMLGVSDHVHVENSGLVELLNNVLGWDTDGGDEETSTRVDDNVNEGIELSLGVIVAIRWSAYGLFRSSPDH